MYKNVGKKIKFFAALWVFINIVVLVFLGTVLIVYGIGDKLKFGILIGAAIIVIGSFLCWYGSLALYGYGQLIENTQVIREKIEKFEENSKHNN